MIEEVVTKIQILWDGAVLVFHEMGCATSRSILTLGMVGCSGLSTHDGGMSCPNTWDSLMTFTWDSSTPYHPIKS